MRFRPCKADRTQFAVLAHALMLFTPPADDVIGALNVFLTCLGEAREIHGQVHTGLPDDLAPEVFLQRLRRSFEGSMETPLTPEIL